MLFALWKVSWLGARKSEFQVFNPPVSRSCSLNATWAKSGRGEGGYAFGMCPLEITYSRNPLPTYECPPWRSLRDEEGRREAAVILQAASDVLTHLGVKGLCVLYIPLFLYWLLSHNTQARCACAGPRWLALRSAGCFYRKVRAINNGHKFLSNFTHACEFQAAWISSP